MDSKTNRAASSLSFSSTSKALWSLDLSFALPGCRDVGFTYLAHIHRGKEITSSLKTNPSLQSPFVYPPPFLPVFRFSRRCCRFSPLLETFFGWRLRNIFIFLQYLSIPCISETCIYIALMTRTSTARVGCQIEFSSISSSIIDCCIRSQESIRNGIGNETWAKKYRKPYT